MVFFLFFNTKLIVTLIVTFQFFAFRSMYSALQKLVTLFFCLLYNCFSLQIFELTRWLNKPVIFSTDRGTVVSPRSENTLYDKHVSYVVHGHRKNVLGGQVLSAPSFALSFLLDFIHVFIAPSHSYSIGVPTVYAFAFKPTRLRNTSTGALGFPNTILARYELCQFLQFDFGFKPLIRRNI